MGSTTSKDIGVADIINPKNGQLSSSEKIVARVYNFGSSDISSFDVSYQIDDKSPVKESYFGGAIKPNSYVDYTFKTTADLSEVGRTYKISAFTTFSQDEDKSNDKITKEVANVFTNDVGVLKIITPESGSHLTSSEAVKVQLKNFGSQDQSTFKIVYNLNGKEVSENYSQKLAANTTAEFSFNQKADFGKVGKYKLSVRTNLDSDQDKSNDVAEVEIKKTCIPSSDCNEKDVIVSFKLGDIDNDSECGKNGYEDYTNLKTEVKMGETYPLRVETKYQNEHIRVWIDFNDDLMFSDDEIVLKDYAIPSQIGFKYYGTVDVTIPTAIKLGEHILRIKLKHPNCGSIQGACDDMEYGETEDYKVVLTGSSASIEDEMIKNSDFVVKDFGDKTFELEMSNLDYDGIINVTLYDVKGKCHVYHNLVKIDGKYTYLLDMSYMPNGVYLVRMGSNNFGRIQKIIVK